MSLNYNKVILAGRLTSDIELKTTTSGKPVATFDVAINKSKDEVNFIPCVAWEKTAEFVANYFRKGSAILVEGSLQSRQYEDKRYNQKRTAYSVNAERISFVESKETKETSAPQEKYEEVTIDNLPF